LLDLTVLVKVGKLPIVGIEYGIPRRKPVLRDL